MNTPKPDWETWLSNTARAYPYPATPQLQPPTAYRSTHQLRHRLMWIMVILIVLVSSLAIPEVRAHVRTWLRIGTIEVVEQAQPRMPPLNRTINQAGEPANLTELQTMLGEPFKLPSYPAELGPPSSQTRSPYSNASALFIWEDQQQQPILVLQILGSTMGAQKIFMINQGQPTTVGEHPAFWLNGEHEVSFINHTTGQFSSYRSTNSTLIWSTGNVTYRLETALDLQQARKIAETISP